MRVGTTGSGMGYGEAHSPTRTGQGVRISSPAIRPRPNGSAQVTSDTALPAEGFRHEAIFYKDETEFVDRTGSFIRAGIAMNEPTLVVVSARKIKLLDRTLGSDARRGGNS